MTTETEELLWIASQENKLIPPALIKFAIQNNKTLVDLLYMEKSDFQISDSKAVDTFLKNRESIPFNVYQKIYDHMHKEFIDLITYRSSIFPENLKKIDKNNVPTLLYHQGKEMKYQNCVAVVGTRNCSTHAVEIARGIGRELSKTGYIIVAGLARGIDAAAHRGAISVGGSTVAVLPWIHDPYPPEHERLLSEIKKSGSVISENFFTAGHIDKFKFIQRNAIISGISDALIAVESSFSGGTRWQVEIALSQGKKIIAIEPEISNKMAYDGFERFVKMGATKAGTASEAIEIIKKDVKIIDHVLDEYDFEEEIKPLQKLQ